MSGEAAPEPVAAEPADAVAYVQVVESMVQLPPDDGRADRIAAQVADLLRDANALNRRMERFSDRDVHPIILHRPDPGARPVRRARA